MPNYQKVIAQKPDITKFTTAPDGNIYTFARLNEGSWMRQLSVHYIYKPWVDKLGKAMPKTTDEFYDLMVAMKNTDLNGDGKPDEIPIAMAWGDQPNGVPRTGPWFVYYAFGLPAQDTGSLWLPISNLFVEDGKVKFAPADERFKQATAYLNKLWKAGLIEPEAFTLTYPQIEAKLEADAGDLRRDLLLEPPGRVHPRGRPARRRVRAAAPLHGPGRREAGGLPPAVPGLEPRPHGDHQGQQVPRGHGALDRLRVRCRTTPWSGSRA